MKFLGLCGVLLAAGLAIVPEYPLAASLHHGPYDYFRVVLYAERVRCIKTRKGRPPQNARFKVEKSRHVFAIATNPWATRSERSEYAFLPQLCLSSFRQCSAVSWQVLC